MVDEPEVVKDPTQKKFWRPRNIILLFLGGMTPAMIGWAGNTVIDKYHAVQDWKHALDAKLKSADEETEFRFRDLENDKANNKAIWDAIAETRTKLAAMEIEHRVAMKLFERDFNAKAPHPYGGIEGRPPSTTPPPQGAEVPQPPPPAPKIDPEQLRIEKEQKYPNQPSTQKIKK